MRRAAIVAALTAAIVGALAAPSGAVGSSRSDVRRFDDGTVVEGATSTLVTNASGARFTFRTSDLPAGHTITIWWVVFNAPQNCIGGSGAFQCGGADLPIFGGDDSAVTSLLYGAGHTIGGSGTGNWGGSLTTGDTEGALFGPGLVNPTGAEIHLVVHDHGNLPPQQRAEGNHNFGPCNPDCPDLQFAVHVQ